MALSRSGRFRVRRPTPGSGSANVIVEKVFSATRKMHLLVHVIRTLSCDLSALDNETLVFFSRLDGMERGLPYSSRFLRSISLSSRLSTLPTALFGSSP